MHPLPHLVPGAPAACNQLEWKHSHTKPPDLAPLLHSVQLCCTPSSSLQTAGCLSTNVMFSFTHRWNLIFPGAPDYNSFYHSDELRLDFNYDETLEALSNWRNFPLDRNALDWLHYFPHMVFLSTEEVVICQAEDGPAECFFLLKHQTRPSARGLICNFTAFSTTFLQAFSLNVLLLTPPSVLFLLSVLSPHCCSSACSPRTVWLTCVDAYVPGSSLTNHCSCPDQAARRDLAPLSSVLVTVVITCQPEFPRNPVGVP